MRFIVIMLLAILSGSAVAQVSSGTAFAIAPGLLITNQHVIAGCGSVDVIAADGRRTGSVVESDSQIDLALLRVASIKGTTARLRNPRNIRLGESVMVFGFPITGSLTTGGNFTSGLVSGLRGLKDAAGEIQITAPVQPGNSGGPLMDASGLVIGVVQAKLDALRAAITTGDIPQNVNFAISLEVLAEFLVRNKVAFLDGVNSAPLETARVAELAQRFTYRVECMVTAKLDAKPLVKPETQRADGEFDWSWPTEGKVIANFNEGTNRGILISGRRGQPVLASASGRVIFSGAGIRSLGKIVVIRHNSIYLSVYGHNESLLVKEGQAVSKGQRVAEMGDSDSDRVNLHFEIRRQGKPVDPIMLLPEAQR